MIEEKEAAVRRGISLFEPIRTDRSCDSAGIPEHWCMCQTRYNVSANDPVVLKVLNFLESEINRMLSKYPQCSKLETSKMIDAKALSHTPSIKPSSPNVSTTTEKSFEPYWTDYSITTKMSPGGAIFESSVRYHPGNDSLSLIDSISRLNAYGNQSACVDDFHMRLYCYCPHLTWSLFNHYIQIIDKAKYFLFFFQFVYSYHLSVVIEGSISFLLISRIVQYTMIIMIIKY